MRKIFYTSQFKRDAKKHFLSFATQEWAEALNLLLNDKSLPQKYEDHALTGELKDLRDCHIKPDLVLLYRKIDERLELVRIGSHNELKIA